MAMFGRGCSTWPFLEDVLVCGHFFKTLWYWPFLEEVVILGRFRKKLWYLTICERARGDGQSHVTAGRDSAPASWVRGHRWSLPRTLASTARGNGRVSTAFTDR